MTVAYYILHHEGAYNVWNSIVDAPVYVSALTLDQLPEALASLGGYYPDAHPERLARAHAKGSSEICGSLSGCISVNRAGRNESKMARDEFIAAFLTLKAPAPGSAPALVDIGTGDAWA